MIQALRHKMEGLEHLRHLYVHIPFCARICPYCAFYKDRLDRSQTDRFCEAILAEVALHAANGLIRPSTIFFGGGTPTALSTRQLRGLLQGFREHLHLSGLREWTIEANPGSVSKQKADVLRELGITRVSLGVQSWDNTLLQLLGREHNAEQAEESFHVFREAGFDNVSIDLMFALPGQSAAQWEASLRKTIALRPEHISAYCLTYEEDTDFFDRHARGELKSSDETEASHFEIGMELLEAAGYPQYEISNYARPGFESLHNRAYWSGSDYLGIGPSAFSTVGWQRCQNVPDYRAYSDFVLSGQSPIQSCETLNAEGKRLERIALSLRTREGLAQDLIGSQTSKSQELIELGLLETKDNRIVLTRRGRAMADTVAAELA